MLMTHSNSHQTIIAGISIVRNQSGKYLFLKRSDQESYGSGLWDFPGGAKEFLESPEEGALRECFEESGLKVTINKLLWYRVSRGVVDMTIEFVSFFYLCDATSDEVTLSAEHDDYQWLTLEEGRELNSVEWMDDFYQQLDSGEITL